MSADETEQHLENLIQTLFNVGVTIEEFESDSKELLFRRINEVIMQLEKVEKSAIGLDNEVPVEVLGYVDEGKNPDLFTKKCLEDCYVENNTTKGKAHALKILSDQMQQLLEETYSQDMKQLSSFQSK